MATGVSGNFDFNLLHSEASTIGTNYYKLRFSYTETYDIATNKSDLTFDIYGYTSGNIYGDTQYVDGQIIVNGDTANPINISSYTGDGSIYFYKERWQKWSGGTRKYSGIAHNSDGTKTISIQFKTRGLSDYYGFGCTSGFYCPWGIGSQTVNLTLTTIPRAAEFSSVPASMTMGAASTIGVSIKSSSFTHTLTYKFGNMSSPVSLTIPSSGSVSWTPPTNLMSYIPNATSGTVTFTLTTKSGSTTIGSPVVKTSTLSVPAASTMSAGNFTMGTAGNITITRYATEFTHTLTWKFVNKSGSLTVGSGNTVSWTPSISDLAGQIPNATSANVVFTLTTKHGTATVGTPATLTKTLSINSYTPTVSLTVAPHSSNTTVNGWGVGVRGYSYISYSTSVTGLNSATVKSYTVTFAGGNTKTTASGNSVVLSNSGSVAVKVVITDSRGKTDDDTKYVTFYDYGKPGYKNQNAFRCNSDGTANPVGTYLSKVITAVNSYSCGGNNTLTCKWRFKLVSDPETGWSAYASLTSGSKDVSPSNLNPGKPYLVELVVTDALGTASSIKVTVPTENVPFNLKEGGKGAAFFGYSQTDGALEVYGGSTYSLRVKRPSNTSVVSSVEHSDDGQTIGMNISSSKNAGLWHVTDSDHGNDGNWLLYTHADGINLYTPKPTVAGSSSNTGDVFVRALNKNGSVELLASQGRGLYDVTSGKWMLDVNATSGLLSLYRIATHTIAISTAYEDIGIARNGAYAGGAFLVIYRNNFNSGASTEAEIGLLKLRYDGSGNPTYTMLAGISGTTPYTTSKLTWSVNTSHVIVKTATSGNSVLHLIGGWGNWS